MVRQTNTDFIFQPKTDVDALKCEDRQLRAKHSESSVFQMKKKSARHSVF